MLSNSASISGAAECSFPSAFLDLEVLHGVQHLVEDTSKILGEGAKAAGEVRPRPVTAEVEDGRKIINSAWYVG